MIELETRPFDDYSNNYYHNDNDAFNLNKIKKNLKNYNKIDI